MGHYFFTPKAVNFTLQSENDIYISPSCMRRKGIELVILDPGHDDSSASRRSDAKVRGGSSSYVFKWPEVHEGQSNMISSYLALEYALAHPKLSADEKKELRTMIRFSRHPGEKYFGDWEQSGGYGTRGGTITSGVENRTTRLNAMAANHRMYDPSSGSFSRTQKVNVTSKAIMLSVHANSTEYFGEGDHIWLIPPKSGADSSLMSSLKSGFSQTWLNFFKILPSDDTTNKNLKNGAASSAQLSNIRTGTHSVNLAVLGTGVSIQRKALLEGWVMNGKVGNLSYRDIKEISPREKIEFYRSGTLVSSYDTSEVYKTYAKSIVRGLNKYLGCVP